MDTQTETPTQVEAPPEPTTELDAARLKEVATKLAEDVRPLVQGVIERADPLVERGRRWADVFLPITDELGPRIDDLRPVMQDLRAQVAERLPLVAAAASRLAARIDMGQVANAGRTMATNAQRLTSLRPTLPSAPSIAAPAIHAPRPVVRLPSLGIGASLRSIARRLRPGRWAFRTTAVGLIALVMSNAALRDAMAEEVNWTRSVLQTIEIPAIQIPSIELPAFELPTIQVPAFEMPNFQFPTQGSSAAAPSKLVPAQFELPPLNAYRALFETQAPYPTAAPNTTVEWVVALRNTGSAGWYRGVAGAQASLALTDGTEAAVQTTAYVAPGQIGWFIVHFRAPAGPGAHSVPLFPRIDGRGELPNLGIYALVTVR